MTKEKEWVEWVRAYFFWSWQYAGRNDDFMNKLKKMKIVRDKLKERGLLECDDLNGGKTGLYDIAYSTGTWIRYKSKTRFVRSDKSEGILTGIMNQHARVGQAKGNMAIDNGVNIEDIEEFRPSENIIVSAKVFIKVQEQIKEYGYTPDDIKWDIASSHELMDNYPIDYTKYTMPSKTADMPITPKGVLPNGKHLLEVDLSCSTNALMRGIKFFKSRASNEKSEDFIYFLMKSIKSKNGVSFYTSGDKSRVIGLWLYDFCKLKKCGLGKAMKGLIEYKSNLDNPEFSYLSSDMYQNFEKWLKRTKNCIKKCEVLTIG